MKFQQQETQSDGGGSLTITAETKAETLEVIKHFRLFDTDTEQGVLAMAEALGQPLPFVHKSEPKKRFWYDYESALDYEFTKPYADLLEKITGHTGQLPDLDLTPHHPRRLCHTHITSEARLEQGHICYTGIVQAEAWNGMTACDHGLNMLEDYMAEDFGFRRFEREYIERGNIMVRNPNYLKRHKAQPGLGAPWFWAVLFDWWRKNHASPEQSRILDASDALKSGWDSGRDYHLRQGGGEQAYLIGSSLYYDDPNGACNWDGKGRMVSVVSWDKFATLAAVQTA